jgi:polysaccharide export outer membrane protein
MVRYFFWAITVAMILSSCVPNRKYVVLQKNDVHDTDMLRDSVLRSYNAKRFEYRVQPHDILSVRFQSLTSEEFDFFGKSNAQVAGAVFGGPLLFGDLVDEKGELSFPVVGKVVVAGLTVFEIQDKLQALADQYLESPSVKVRLLNFRVTVMGEIGREGTISINNNRATLLEVITLAGGLGELADRSKIKLIRQQGSEVDVQYLNVLDENFITSPYYYAHQNDILVVPPLKQRTFRKYFAGNVSLIVSSVSLVFLVINLTR